VQHQVARPAAVQVARDVLDAHHVVGGQQALQAAEPDAWHAIDGGEHERRDIDHGALRDQAQRQLAVAPAGIDRGQRQEVGRAGLAGEFMQDQRAHRRSARQVAEPRRGDDPIVVHQHADALGIAQPRRQQGLVSARQQVRRGFGKRVEHRILLQEPHPSVRLQRMYRVLEKHPASVLEAARPGWHGGRQFGGGQHA
jgi:hypothetical protein